ncbi:MFS transporter [Lentilactobacillus buchneri]|uniref:Major facilitator superfamily (MFS) profile domain-containing protein n=1 Tax=Lentilactobacillus buchneri DSM 20057 TaxID=1423728 RepID=A0A4R5NM63_LENBU|nr:MFS transporter [Lentilactobacillus buchneri]KRK66747.1 major facilitator superfamily protein [Lentilactobacillus buchneri DSM 20057]MCT3253270.1 MFS transporter [Lentilactobacillus buchneri]MCT3547863.1 MFS transporter [Lentilactobacillus buchneri]MCT4438266.1 MFS transporter [Lentilactobacillus buchneri]MQM71452.1 multidrug efflux MFS transporter [Lentilactobacillus buchneri]
MSNTNEKISRQTYLALLAAALLSFTGILTETSMNVTFPELTKVFNVTLDTVQWITTGYLLMVTIVMATTAFLLKKFKSQSIHLLAAIAFVVGDIMCATSANFPILMSGRLIQAIATGLSTPLMFHIIFNKIPAGRIGSMTGLAGMVISLAPALGPTYGGTVSSTMSWRMIFWLILPIIVISWYLGSRYIRIDPVGTGGFDVISLIFLAATLFSFVFGVSKAGKYPMLSGQVLIPFVIGFISLAIFIYSDTHGKTQLLDIRILKWLSSSLSAFTYFVLQFVNIGVSFLIPVYCQYVLHSSPFIAGLVLLPGSLVGAAISPYAGHLADSKGYALPIILGLSSMTLGGLIFFGIQAVLTAWIVLLNYTFLRFGFNMGFSNTISNAMLNVPRKYTADVNSLFSMIQQFAGSIGVGIMAAVMAISQNNGTGSLAARSFVGGKYDFLLATLLSAAALIAAVINFRLQKRMKLNIEESD